MQKLMSLTNSPKWNFLTLFCIYSDIVLLHIKLMPRIKKKRKEYSLFIINQNNIAFR
jgi:hypothetical protein